MASELRAEHGGAGTEFAALVALFTPAERVNATMEDYDCAVRLVLRRAPGEKGRSFYAPLIEKGMKRTGLFRDLLKGRELANADAAHRETVLAAYRAAVGPYASVPGAVQWFHSIALPDGHLTDGLRPNAVLMREADAVFDPERLGPLAGRSLLDIGAWDGFFSFEAERRGAGAVLSVDHPSWSGASWGTKDGYDLAHRVIGSAARSKDVDLFDLDPEREGRHDIVLLLGVLYHLRDPFGGLSRAAAMAREVLVVETVTDCNTMARPVLRHFPGAELNHDVTNMFAPNTACLRSMLSDLGFRRIEIRRSPGVRPGAAPDAVFDRDRHIVHAWR